MISLQSGEDRPCPHLVGSDVQGKRKLRLPIMEFRTCLQNVPIRCVRRTSAIWRKDNYFGWIGIRLWREMRRDPSSFGYAGGARKQ